MSRTVCQRPGAALRTTPEIAVTSLCLPGDTRVLSAHCLRDLWTPRRDEANGGVNTGGAAEQNKTKSQTMNE